MGGYSYIKLTPKNFSYLELCKAIGYGLTYRLMDMGLEVHADIQADGTGLQIQSDDVQPYLSIQR